MPACSAGWGVACRYGLDGPYSVLVDLAACAIVMTGWSLLVDKVHRSATTGIDWSAPRAWRASLDTSLTKLAGYWATWAAMALIYGTFRFYWVGNFQFAMSCFTVAAPVLFVGSIPYVLWLDRYLVEPRDGAWALGAWLTGQPGIETGARSRAICGPGGSRPSSSPSCWPGAPGGYGAFVRGIGRGSVPRSGRAQQPGWSGSCSSIDMIFATVGYILTFRPLDSHIRSANPVRGGVDGGADLLSADQHDGERPAAGLFHRHAGLGVLVPVASGAAVRGRHAALVVLAGIYAWATVAFGPRFSNLTNRGILTHGPYRFTRHPAYLAKNCLWWLTTVPVLTMGSGLRRGARDADDGDGQRRVLLARQDRGSGICRSIPITGRIASGWNATRRYRGC